MLFCASLPRCYTAADGVAVLGLTQELKIHARRRLPQTGQMVFDIMSKDGLTHNSKGLISAIKVRIMHAAVRKMILSDPHPGTGQMKGLGHIFNKVEWDESQGVPISQEAMCGTLLAFSYEVLFAMRKSGVYLSPKEVDAYLHCWNVAGDVLGVRRDLMAHTYAEAEQLTNLLAERNVRSTKEGIVLTEVLMDYMDEMSKELMPLGKIIPFGKIPKLITRICIGGDDCKAVGLNYNPVELIAIPPLWLALHGAGLVKMVVNQIHPLNHHLSSWLFGKMGALMKQMEDKDGFKIPTELDPA